jgi:hypothetical protein
MRQNSGSSAILPRLGRPGALAIGPPHPIYKQSLAGGGGKLPSGHRPRAGFRHEFPSRFIPASRIGTILARVP